MFFDAGAVQEVLPSLRVQLYDGAASETRALAEDA